MLWRLNNQSVVEDPDTQLVRINLSAVIMEHFDHLEQVLELHHDFPIFALAGANTIPVESMPHQGLSE